MNGLLVNLCFYKDELKLLFASKKPRHVIDFCAILSKLCILQFLKAFFPKKYFLPAGVRTALENLNFDYFLNDSGSIVSFKKGYEFGSIEPIELATCRVQISKPEDWTTGFLDPEDNDALNRWSWLRSDSYSAKQLELMLLSWVETVDDHESSIASDSYAISERLSNLSCYLERNNIKFSQLSNSVKLRALSDSRKLARSLEYFPFNFTGNHVLNNARAMLTFGCLTNDQGLVRLAEEVLRNQVRELFFADGCLREGSVHYTILVSTWIFECAIFAKLFKKDSVLEILCSGDLLEKCFNANEFFLVEKKKGVGLFPLFGDVSPDCSPSAAVKRYSSALKRCVKLKLLTGAISNLCPGRFSAKNPILCLSYSGFYRIKFKGWTLFLHLPKAGGEAEGSHAHHDFLSPVAYYNGVEMLIDIGRKSYSQTCDNLRGYVGPLAHSTICLNNVGPQLTRRDKFLGKKYREMSFSIDYETHCDGISVNVHHDGFCRISNEKVLHTRIFQIFEKQLVIRDHLYLDKKRPVTTNFYFSDNCQIEPELTLLQDGQKSCAHSWDVVTCSSAPQYGVEKKCFRASKNINLEGNIQLSQTFTPR